MVQIDSLLIQKKKEKKNVHFMLLAQGLWKVREEWNIVLMTVVKNCYCKIKVHLK
jgi:hypothetical protein